MIGLTGGIACGKSTVAGLFQEHGIESVDADLVVRELLISDQALLRQIESHFGTEYFDNSGALDRKALRKSIFSNTDDRKYLESLIHPMVRELLISEKSNIHSAYGIFVIPLLIEARMTDLVDRILVIDIPEGTQIERIMHRDNISREMALEAISSQISRSERLEYADDVIDNTAPIDDLRNTVASLHKKYLKLAQAH
jgi:dephospho-CoA kinase